MKAKALFFFVFSLVATSALAQVPTHVTPADVAKANMQNQEIIALVSVLSRSRNVECDSPRVENVVVTPSEDISLKADTFKATWTCYSRSGRPEINGIEFEGYAVKSGSETILRMTKLETKYNH